MSHTTLINVYSKRHQQLVLDHINAMAKNAHLHLDFLKLSQSAMSPTTLTNVYRRERHQQLVLDHINAMAKNAHQRLDVLKPSQSAMSHTTLTNVYSKRHQQLVLDHINAMAKNAHLRLDFLKLSQSAMSHTTLTNVYRHVPRKAFYRDESRYGLGTTPSETLEETPRSSRRPSVCPGWNCGTGQGFPIPNFPENPRGNFPKLLTALEANPEVEINWQELLSLTELEGIDEQACYPPPTHAPPPPDSWPPYPPPPQPWAAGGGESDSGLSLDSSPEAWKGPVSLSWWCGPQASLGPGPTKPDLGPGCQLGPPRLELGLNLQLAPKPEASFDPQPELALTSRLGLNFQPASKLQLGPISRLGPGLDLDLQPGLQSFLGFNLQLGPEPEVGLNCEPELGPGLGLNHRAGPKPEVGLNFELNLGPELGLNRRAGPEQDVGQMTEVGPISRLGRIPEVDLNCEPDLGLELGLNRQAGSEPVSRLGRMPEVGLNCEYERCRRGEDQCRNAACSRDDRRARALRMPVGAEALVRLPVDDYNDLLSRHRLSPAQLALARDIRRRGKNKVAAQHCRRRRLEGLVRLQGELGGLRRQQALLEYEREEVGRALDQARESLDELGRSLIAGLRDTRGRPYNRGEVSLRLGEDGALFLVRREGEGEEG
ncbi:uncharacterized protein LOC144611242 [Rhinoraja longicauda]